MSLGSTSLVPGISGLDVGDYRRQTPLLDPYVFFDGRLEAWGIVQDWRKRVTRRFYVDITGSLAGDQIILDEKFSFSDGERSTRQWRIHRGAGGRISADADDVIGTAAGRLAGNAMSLNYAMDLPVGGRSVRVRFNDGLWQIDERVLFNRARIKKFGLTVAEVSLFMRRVD